MQQQTRRARIKPWSQFLPLDCEVISNISKESLVKSSCDAPPQEKLWRINVRAYCNISSSLLTLSCTRFKMTAVTRLVNGPQK